MNCWSPPPPQKNLLHLQTNSPSQHKVSFQFLRPEMWSHPWLDSLKLSIPSSACDALAQDSDLANPLSSFKSLLRSPAQWAHPYQPCVIWHLLTLHPLALLISLVLLFFSFCSWHLTSTTPTTYSFNYFHSMSLLGREFHLFCSLIYPKHVIQQLVPRKHPINNHTR